MDESSTTPGNGQVSAAHNQGFSEIVQCSEASIFTILQIRIDNKQHYEIGSVKFDTISLILLEVRASGRNIVFNAQNSTAV